MKALWLSTANTMYDEKGDRAYNGKGWIASLQDAVSAYAPGLELGVAFLSGEDSEALVRDGITYYKIKRKSPSGFKKLYANWAGTHGVNYDNRIMEIVNDFRPDLVHVFGCESYFASAVLSVRDIPVIIHIQGILSEYIADFFPPGTRKRDMITPRTFWNEAVLRNGYIHLYDDYAARAEKERECLKGLKYAMGRTSWDKRSLAKYSGAEYFHVDEVLRSGFYKSAGTFAAGTDISTAGRQICLSSTLSPFPYKGLDMVLKCAYALTAAGYDVKWNIAGIRSSSDIVNIIERKTGIRSSECGVRYKGVLSEDGLISTLKDAEIYVHTSYIENSPNSVCEAQMLGMPVIATDAGGTSTLVHDNMTGLLVPVGNSNALADAIITLHSCPEQRERLGKAAAAAAAERHEPKKIVEDLSGTYCRLTGASSI